jgi:hypothetical protein
MAPTTKKRFKIGLHPSYDKCYDAVKSKSGILTPQGECPINFEALVTSDESGCRAMLRQIKGDDTGRCRDTFDNWIDAQLTTVLKHLGEKARLAFGNGYTPEEVQAVLDGKSPYPPEADTDHGKLWADFWYALANVDCRLEEIDKLGQRIAHFEATKRAETVLPYGPVGRVEKDENGKVIRIDGQTVNTDHCIDDPLSPYTGMNVVTYMIDLVMPWKQKAQRQKRGGFVRIEKSKLPRPPAGARP